ncbi:hypothetical protein BDU57DRAFT_140326 [Ampelomyces quisqualis]|uniref:Uncharacterized protein n=1 Tax=Ampelomyces quisqualis TaxID=50730 RepID=A0A6A5QUD3_AMPQU|nr:hypothetical protein BDU57DRAFT_140326 [Ampelomyces quisqualis]
MYVRILRCTGASALGSRFGRLHASRPATLKYDFIKQQPMAMERKVRVILMGAGAPAINFFMENLETVCYERIGKPA